MAVIECPENPVKLDRPPVGGVGPVLGRPERVVGDEQLRPIRREGGPELIRRDALVRLPALALKCQADDPRDRGLPHLRRAAQHRETVPLEHRHRRVIGTRRDKHRGKTPRRPLVPARTMDRPAVQRGVEIAHAEQRRPRTKTVRRSGKQLAELVRAENGDAFSLNDR